MVASRGFWRGPDGRPGYALFAVLVAVLLVVAAGSLITSHLVRRMALLNDQHRDLHVQALIDTGISLAMAQVREDYYYTGVRTEVLDGGQIRFEIERTSPQLRLVRLESSYRGEKRTARVTIFIELPGALPLLNDWDPVPIGDDCTGIFGDGCPDTVDGLM